MLYGLVRLEASARPRFAEEREHTGPRGHPLWHGTWFPDPCLTDTILRQVTTPTRSQQAAAGTCQAWEAKYVEMRSLVLAARRASEDSRPPFISQVGGDTSG